MSKIVEFQPEVKTKRQKIAYLSSAMQVEDFFEGKQRLLVQLIGELAKGTIYEKDIDSAIESLLSAQE